MKTVSGKVISTAPISISKAASIISKFSSADNGASQAISAYLRRASVAFSELSNLHKELNLSSKSQGKHKRSKSDVTEEEKLKRRMDAGNGTGQVAELDQERSQGFGGELSHGVDGRVGMESEKMHKKKNKEEDKEIDNNKLEENGGRIGRAENGVKMELEGEKKEARKKRKSEQVEQGGEIGSEEQRSKKKKIRKTEGDS